jgi:hypothetical protein
MTDKLFTSSERKEYEAIARRRGFQSLRDYMRTLIERDAEAAEAEDDDELLDPEESFRIAWADAMEGRTLTYEELQRRILEDAD